MRRHGDNGMSEVGGTRGHRAMTRENQSKKWRQGLFLPGWVKIGIWRTVPTLFVLSTNRRKLTFGKLCYGVFVKESAQRLSPSFSMRISFFIRPLYVNVCVRRAVPCLQVSSLNARPQSLFYLSLWGYFFSLCKSITQTQESVSLSSKWIRYLTNRHSILVEKAWNSKLFLRRLNIGILMKHWNIFPICWRKGWDEFRGCLIFSI